jgi:hypothetical protein
MLICVSGLALVSPASALAKRCGRVYVPARGYHAKVRVRTGPESCRAAKRLISAAFTAEVRRRWDGYDKYGGVIWRVSGWRCGIGLGGSQAFCSRGSRSVDGSFRADDGWRF